jgi:hypothetical protein
MDALEKLHQDWLGMAQPEGLVVTASVLKQQNANITWPANELQAQLTALIGDGRQLFDLRRLLREILGWDDDFVVEVEQLPDTLRFKVEGGGVLEPRLALKSADDDSFVFLVGQEPLGTELDKASEDPHVAGTPSQRFERLLRESGVFAGLLTNGHLFRLMYAPKGESSGWINFPLFERKREDGVTQVVPAALLKVDGRALLAAFHMLLNQGRLLTGEPEQRLTGLLKGSREYQNTVSEKLREQVLAALRELLTGFQDADRRAKGVLLRDYQGDRQGLYTGLVTTLMRMIFVLYAEERKLLPMDSDLYANSYSLTQLYSQLIQDRDRYSEDALSERFGAWARIVTLFRVLHDGVTWYEGSQPVAIPSRKGTFFDPNAFPFLEGRAKAGARQIDVAIDPPRVSDGVLFRVLNHLLLLNGERLQYKGLDVEQVGAVYEGLMGFDVELAEGESIPLTSKHVVVDLEKLLSKPVGDRVKELKELGVDTKGKIEDGLKKAKTTAELKAGLARRIPEGGSDIPKGALFLQPGEERRRTGSHYTPRKLTAPIVETTLRPVLEQLGPEPTPAQILALKVCDPAMGSGAFLVEACRQLADHLVAAWRRTGTTPEVPPDEDVTLHARRLVAQQCLYGVDKNPLAADLARLSMWLVTFAKLHPFTFVDHALRYGDSLVGVSREQIASFSLDISRNTQIMLVRPFIARRMRKVEDLRKQIHAKGDPPEITELAALWKQVQEELEAVRLIGDLVVAAFFARDKDKERRAYTTELSERASRWLQVGDGEAHLREIVAELRDGTRPVPSFHWEIEFPEVFTDKGGFDCFIGNPPWMSFSGRQAVAESPGYIAWLSRFSSFSGWRSLHACFVEQSLRQTNEHGAVGLVLPATVAELDGYSDCRRVIRSMAMPIEPMAYFGENAFSGVVLPTFAFLAHRTPSNNAADGAVADSPFALSAARGTTRSDVVEGAASHVIVSEESPGALGRGDLMRSLKNGMRVPDGAFKDPGVHTGNCSKTLIAERPSGKSSPVREGKDLSAYRVAAPRKWLVLDHVPTEGEYFRIGDLTAYKRIPIVLRQTAHRPIAALHRDPTYFRNSILACLGLPGVDDRAIVCWLNSSIVAWYHLQSTREASQKAFPQVKIKHLMSIPVPEWTPDIISRLTRLHDQRVETTGERANALDTDIDIEIGAAYGITAEISLAVRDEIGGTDQADGS